MTDEETIADAKEIGWELNSVPVSNMWHLSDAIGNNVNMVISDTEEGAWAKALPIIARHTPPEPTPYAFHRALIRLAVTAILELQKAGQPVPLVEVDGKRYRMSVGEVRG